VPKGEVGRGTTTNHVSGSASVSHAASIAPSVRIWNFAQIREHAVIGENTIIGSYVYIDSNVRIGRNCKIQNRSLVYEPSLIQDDVFIGPGVTLTNDRNPRAVNESGKLKSEKDWAKVGVVIENGASIGAGAICVAPVRVGSWALVGAGSIVTKDVPAYALVVGNPAKQIGWVGRKGFPLAMVSDGVFQCPESMEQYALEDGMLTKKETN
jgi:UDP-2-acetamido-3-amino-2,3-dideoxy-glucuronate N-acetyltransferase